MVSGGTVKGFSYGILVGEEDYSHDPGDPIHSARISRVNFVDDGTGLRAVESRAVVSASTFRENSIGADSTAGDLLVTTSRFTQNHRALSAFGVTALEVQASVVTDDEFGLECWYANVRSRATVWTGNDVAVGFSRCGGSTSTYDTSFSNGANLIEQRPPEEGDTPEESALPVVRCSLFLRGPASEVPVSRCRLP